MGTASEYFGAMVREYDSLIRRTVPRYDEMLERLVHYLPPDARSVLELGCGTGNLSAALVRHHPRAELVLVDAAPEMVEACRARLADAGDRVTGRVARFEELPGEAASFDLVTSAISLHHVADKAALYARLFELLRPGGSLVFADQLRGGDGRLHGLNWQAWIDFSRRPGGTSEEELAGLLRHADEHDHYTPLVEHLDLLSGAGFVDLDCVWRNWIWGILVARRPG